MVQILVGDKFFPLLFWSHDLMIAFKLTPQNTHAHSTVQPATDPPNAPTPTQLDYEQSGMTSYALQLCSIWWPTAALFCVDNSTPQIWRLLFG